MLLTALFYTMAMVMVAGLILSYAVAYKISKSKSILALFLFVFAVGCLNFAVVLDYWSRVMNGDRWVMPLNWVRALFMFLASAYFLYTTWETNKK